MDRAAQSILFMIWNLFGGDILYKVELRQHGRFFGMRVPFLTRSVHFANDLPLGLKLPTWPESSYLKKMMMANYQMKSSTPKKGDSYAGAYWLSGAWRN